MTKQTENEYLEDRLAEYDERVAWTLPMAEKHLGSDFMKSLNSDETYDLKGYMDAVATGYHDQGVWKYDEMDFSAEKILNEVLMDMQSYLQDWRAFDFWEKPEDVIEAQKDSLAFVEKLRAKVEKDHADHMAWVDKFSAKINSLQPSDLIQDAA